VEGSELGRFWAADLVQEGGGGREVTLGGSLPTQRKNGERVGGSGLPQKRGGDRHAVTEQVARGRQRHGHDENG
jgi:hypothetical protein